MYWIPCGEGRWLQAQTTDLKFLGLRSAKIRSDAQVTQKFTKGELLVSLSVVDHVKEIVSHSKTAFEIVQNLLRYSNERSPFQLSIRLSRAIIYPTSIVPSTDIIQARRQSDSRTQVFHTLQDTS